MKFLFHLVTAALSLSAHSQYREMVIADLLTRKPVPFVTVKLLNREGGAIASADGKFALPLNEDDSLLLTSVGYTDTKIACKTVKDTIFLELRESSMKPFTVRTIAVSRSQYIGLGVPLIGKKVRCEYDGGKPGDCVPWTNSKGTEFAELMTLPDSSKSYRLGKLMLPMKTSDCWTPLFINVYAYDTITKAPGEMLARLPVEVTDKNYEKGKILFDLTKEQIIFNDTKHFFLGLSWKEDIYNQPYSCLTGIVLLRSEQKLTFSRSFAMSEYNWFRFCENCRDENGKCFQTAFAVEVQELVQ